MNLRRPQVQAFATEGFVELYAEKAGGGGGSEEEAGFSHWKNPLPRALLGSWCLAA